MSGLIYVPQVSADGLGRQALPQTSDGSMTAQATARLGQSLETAVDGLVKVGERQARIDLETDKARRETAFLVGLDDTNQKYQNDPDPSTAPQRYKEEVAKLRETALDGFSPNARAEFDLHLRRKEISAVADQRFTSLKRQADQYTGNLDAQYQIFTNRYAAAKTDAERIAVQGELDASLQSGVRTGMLTNKAAEGYRQALAKTGDEALALRAIGQNAAAAQAEFADPAKYTGLDPVRRQQLAEHARAAAEEQRAAGIVQQARFNPAAAALSAGRLTDPRQAEIIFDKAIIPQESGGNPNAVSAQGALGVSQIMPDTARAVAARLGKSEIANMGNLQLKQRLTSDPALARELGLAYFKENLATFNGNLAPTIASYHAGPGGSVAKAHAAAVAAHGEGYSVDQFLAFMPGGLKDGSGKHTVDYVRDIFKRMGVATNAPAMSTMASYRLGNAVGHEIDRELARQQQTISQLTALAGRETDRILPVLKDGYTPDPAAVAPLRATLTLAADRGDANAAERLRSLEDAVRLQPVVAQMWRMRPEDIEAELATARQQMAAGPVTPQQRERVNILEKVHGEIVTARKENPIALIERQGIAPATPVNVQADLADRGQRELFMAQINARAVASDQAKRLYGTRAFFRPDERVAFKQRYEGLGTEAKIDLLETLRTAAPNENAYRAAVSEIAGNDRLAQTAGMFFRTNPGVARDIMRGAEIAQLEQIKPKAEEVKQALKASFTVKGYPPAMQEDLIQAGLAVYAAERGKNATLWDATDRNALKASFEKIIGPTADINGRAVPMGRGISPRQAESLFGRGGLLTQAGLDAQGGAKDEAGQPLTAAFIKRHATLVPADDRIGDHQRYRVVLPQGGVDKGILRADGKGYLYFSVQEIFAAERMNVGNETANPSEVFTRDRRTGALLYPATGGRQ